ncbi:hypothetical protein MMC06_006374 [Schaereria dolodes]|nr:hypothetical protein [Schaereria dolodes]
MTLTSKTILITGASRGIGRAIALRFASEHAKRLVLVGRDSTRLASVQESVASKKAQPLEIVAKPGDVKDRSFWESMGKEMGSIDVLVNAAGIAHSSLLVTTKPELLEEVIQTNLMGTVWGCQIMAKVMMRQRRSLENTGCIINVSSLLALKGGRGSTVYAASKAGVLGLARSLAAELGPSNIRVNTIVPGYVETDMTEGMTSQARLEALDIIPQKRFGKPEEVADAALFLATNAYANNCILNIDGGLSAT